jgi:hypothetical protein
LDLGIKFANWIGPALAQAQPYIDMISNGIGMAVDYIMQMVNGTSEWSGWIDVIGSVFSTIWDLAVKIGIKLWGFVSSVMEFVKHSQMLKDLFLFLGWIIEKVGSLIGGVVDIIVWLWENVLKPILTAIDWVYKHLTGRGLEVNNTTTLVAPKAKPTPIAPKDSPLGVGGSLAASNDASGKAAGDTVSGAGPKVINITIGKFFDNLQFTTLNTKETVQELENVVLECLSRVVYNGSKTA